MFDTSAKDMATFIQSLPERPKRNLFQRHNRWWLAKADWDGGPRNPESCRRITILGLMFIPAINVIVAGVYLLNLLSTDSVERFFLGDD